MLMFMFSNENTKLIDLWYTISNMQTRCIYLQFNSIVGNGQKDWLNWFSFYFKGKSGLAPFNTFLINTWVDE